MSNEVLRLGGMSRDRMERIFQNPGLRFGPRLSLINFSISHWRIFPSSDPLINGRHIRSRPSQFSSVDAAAPQLWPRIALRHKHSQPSICWCRRNSCWHPDLSRSEPPPIPNHLSAMFLSPCRSWSTKSRQDVWVSVNDIVSSKYCTCHAFILKNGAKITMLRTIGLFKIFFYNSINIIMVYY